jgi:branched-subunit amino acid transport protein AzlD
MELVLSNYYICLRLVSLVIIFIDNWLKEDKRYNSIIRILVSIAGGTICYMVLVQLVF